MTFALLLAAVDPSYNGGSTESSAEYLAARREAEAASRVRDRAWAEAMRSDRETDAQTALESIMHTYADRLIRFAYGFVKTRDTAEDIIQDVFVRVWERRNAIRPEESLRALLFTAVRRAALDVLKRRAVEVRHAGEVQGSGDSYTLTVDEQLDADTLAQQVRVAIARLPERRRTALRLRYEEQLPFTLVAEIMELSEKAAKHLVTRAVEDIREFLKL